MPILDPREVSLVGQTIGNYRVVQQIGEGGMGVVYLAEHPVIGRKVAIKLLHSTFARDSETVARFFNEARAIHTIAHPNIVEILDFGQTSDGQPYFTMEYLSGQSLAERIAQGPMQAADAVTIVSQICEALQAAHDKNVVHRDLKPHNVYLIGNPAKPTVKVLDFGVAKISNGWADADSGGHSVKTRTGSVMGTPLYMSPEQCRGSGKLDHRTDIYSLAVILYEMIAGTPPFTAEGVGELFAKHMLEPPPSLGAAAPKTPPPVVRAVARALSKDLEDRFPTMNAFREALNGRLDVTDPSVQPRTRMLAHVSTLGNQSPGGTGSVATTTETGRTPRAATTLSGAVAQVDDASLILPRKSKAGLVIGVVAALTVLAGGGIFLLKSDKTGSGDATGPHPPPPKAAEQPIVPPPPETVVIRFEAEPETTHVLRKVAGRAQGEDLGAVPIDLKMTRSADIASYVFHADGFKDRTVTVDATRDLLQHLVLDRVPPPEKAPDKDKKVVRQPPPHPVRPKKPAVHDADGLAVPSF